MALMDELNNAAREARRVQYELMKTLGLGRRTLVAEGDSWFQHPIEVDLIDALSCLPCGYRVRSLGAAGDWLGHMLEQREFVAAIREEDPEAFLFSGGGNDVVSGSLHGLLRDSPNATDADQCIDFARLDGEMSRLAALYQRVYALVQAAKPDLPMFVHGYAHPDPGRKYYILLLDWGLADTLAARHVPGALWDPVAARIIDRFNDMLATLAGQLPHLHHVDLRDTVDRNDFVDELHLNSFAALKAATRFREEIERVLA